MNEQANEKKVGIPEPIKLLLAEFQEIILDELLDGLSPMRNIYHIDFMSRASLPKLSHYQMSLNKGEIFKENVEKLLRKGQIQKSLIPYRDIALLTPNKDSSQRMFIDSSAINKITMRYKFLIPQLDDILDQLHRASIFTKIDLRSVTIKFRFDRVMSGKQLSRQRRDCISGWLCLLGYLTR